MEGFCLIVMMCLLCVYYWRLRITCGRVFCDACVGIVSVQRIVCFLVIRVSIARRVDPVFCLVDLDTFVNLIGL